MRLEGGNGRVSTSHAQQGRTSCILLAGERQKTERDKDFGDRSMSPAVLRVELEAQ